MGRRRAHRPRKRPRSLCVHDRHRVFLPHRRGDAGGEEKLNGESMEAEGCPPLSQALAQKALTDLPSCNITANPEYKHLFPKGDEVTENL